MTVSKVQKPLDREKLYELASHPGTFPEMVLNTYNVGLEEGKEKGKKQTEQEIAARLNRSKRQVAWVATFISAPWLACPLFNCFVLHAMR